MGRPPRIDYAGAWHHVMNRGASRQIVFHHDDDYLLFLSGPRQVGKTTSARHMAEVLGDAVYLNWDNADHRRTILAGPGAIARAAGLDRLRDEPPTLVLDEIHKLRLWKDLLKGFFDTYGDRIRIEVTGSAQLV